MLIRLWGIDYGLPFVYWTDEYHEVMRALELGTGGLNLSRTGKGGFYILLFFEYGVYFLALKVLGVISTTQQFAEQFVRDPTSFYIIGRATAALFGALTVASVFLLARRAYGKPAGMLAALFLSVNVLHVDLSHRVGVDIPMAFFATAALYYAVRIAEGGGRRDYLLAALFAALAMTTKLPGILVVPSLLIAHAYRVSRAGGTLNRWIASKEFWLAVVVFAVVLVSTNPGILFKTDWLTLYSTSTEVMGEDEFEAAMAVETVGRPNLYIYYLGVIRDSMGWPLLALAALSIGYAARKRRAPDVLLLAYAALTYLAIASTSAEFLYYPRYALPITVVLSLLSGRAFSELTQAVPHQRVFLAGIVAVVLIAWPAGQSIRHSYSLTQTDTRSLAKEWFDANVPPGRKVLIEGGKIAASRLTAPLSDSLEALERRIAYWESIEPRQARYLRFQRAVHEGGGHDLELVRVATVTSLDDYIARGVEYFVVRPETFIGARKAKGGSARLLNSLRSDARVRLLRRFEPASSLQPGPTIEIYQFRSDPARDE
jgi:hypothetical protein